MMDTDFLPIDSDEAKALMEWDRLLNDAVRALLGWPRCENHPEVFSGLIPDMPLSSDRAVVTPFGRARVSRWCESCLRIADPRTR